jgi:outer membrane protein assembly factor BamB
MASESDTAALIEKSGVKGGLALVLGAKDPSLATALVEKGGFYVQVLQPDAKLAAQWGQAAGGSANRESLSVRNAAFDPAHYDSDLFNLIAVEDAAGLGAAKLADLFRLLVPAGCVAFRSAPAGFADEAGKLKMEALAAGSFQAIFRKPVLPVVWMPYLVRKWSAEPNDHNCAGWSGVTSGGGKFFYREMMEVEGEQWKKGRWQLFARDAYNGRTLWTREEPVGWDNTGPMAADNKGRLFAFTSDGKLVCLDADTGKQRFVLMEKGAEGVIELHDNDKYVFACGKVFSTEDGKLLWTLPLTPNLGLSDCSILPYCRYRVGAGLQVCGDSIYVCDAKTLKIMKLADGQTQTLTLEGVPDPKSYGGLIVSGRHLVIGTGCNLTSVDTTTGKALWTWTANWSQTISTNLGLLSALSVSTRERQVNAWGTPKCFPDGDKLVIMRRPNGSIVGDILFTRLDLVTGKADSEKTLSNTKEDCNMACHPFRGRLGDYLVSPWNWINVKTLENTVCRMSGGSCSVGQIPAKDAPLILVVPDRKNRWINCDASVAALPAVPKGPGWKNLQKFAQATSAEPTKEGDWPAFRGGGAMGNSSKTTLGDKLVKAWEVQIGLGGKTFGMMSSRHIGLTQAVLAYGLAIISDIEGQRIVAVDAADGKTKWIFHVGSRADYPPAIYNGLCLFEAKDGWVYCLDAKTGALVWKNLPSEMERYIGGCEGLATPFIQDYGWGNNLDQNVLVADGLGYVEAAIQFQTDDGSWRRDKAIPVVFKPETGELVNSSPTNPAAGGAGKLTAGRRLVKSSYAERLLKGNSLPRQFAENEGPKLNDGRASGQVLAFDEALSVAFNEGYGEGEWRTAKISLSAVKDDPKKPLWKLESPDFELVTDDIVMTPSRIYCVGHYQRVAKPPELWVVSREEGKVINTVPVEGFPAFLGMSASGNRLFLATREGKLICYQGGE